MLAFCLAIIAAAAFGAGQDDGARAQVLKSAHALVDTGQAFFKKHDYARAEDSCGAAIKLFAKIETSDMAARMLLGEVYLPEQRNAEALAEFRTWWKYGQSGRVDLCAAIAAARCGQSRLAHMGIGSHLDRWGPRIEKLIGGRQFLPGIKTDEQIESSAFLLLGILPETEPDEALADFIHADQMTPGNALAAYLIGKAYADAKQWDRAKTYLDKASALATGKLSDLVREALLRGTR